MMNERMTKTTVPKPDAATTAEFDWLMSLALDESLDAEEHTRFEALLAGDSSRAADWAAWQFIDAELELTPALVPTSGFVGRFETHLTHYEQQRQRRIVWLAASLALLAGAIVFVGTASLGAFVFLI